MNWEVVLRESGSKWREIFQFDERGSRWEGELSVDDRESFQRNEKQIVFLFSKMLREGKRFPPNFRGKMLSKWWKTILHPDFTIESSDPNQTMKNGGNSFQ